MNTLIGNLVSALFSGYPREIDLVLILLGIHHDHMNQVLVNGGIEALKTDGAEKINPVTLTEIKLGMFNTGIVPNLGMQQKQSFFPPCIPDPENNIFPHPQLTAAIRTNIMVLHVVKGDRKWSPQDTKSHRSCQLNRYIYMLKPDHCFGPNCLMNSVHLQVLTLLRSNRKIAWATVIRSSGSTPQKPGSSAIFNEKGLVAGTVGGGVMEAEVETLAAGLLKKKGSNQYNFNLDSKQGEEGAICGGEALVLIDADPGAHSEALEKMEWALKKREGGRLLTLVGREKDHFRTVERYWIPDNDLDSLRGPVHAMVRDALIGNPSQGKHSDLRMLELPGSMEITHELAYMEFVAPLPRLVIAGAGHIGKALAHLGRLLEFEVTVVDDRPEYANPVNIPDATHLIVQDIGKAMSELDPDSDTYCIIVTRGHHQDGEALRPLIGSKAAYVGMVGSRHKVGVMKKRFLDNGWTTPIQWEAIHAPIGLPIGSVTVQEIAVSIAAQLIDIRNKNQKGDGK
jgi:xanthine dehydrogenase accessory factor